MWQISICITDPDIWIIIWSAKILSPTHKKYDLTLKYDASLLVLQAIKYHKWQIVKLTLYLLILKSGEQHRGSYWLLWIYIIFVSGDCMHLIIKICQTFGGIRMTNQFHKALKSNFWPVFVIWPMPRRFNKFFFKFKFRQMYLSCIAANEGEKPSSWLLHSIHISPV